MVEVNIKKDYGKTIDDKFLIYEVYGDDKLDQMFEEVMTLVMRIVMVDLYMLAQ